VVQGDVLLHDCRNTLAMSTKRLVACIGVDDLVVVETSDAILIAHKDKTQDVKQIVDHLKRDGRAEGQLHRKVFRPWGSYDGVDAGERFLVNASSSIRARRFHCRCITTVPNTGRSCVEQRR